MLVLVMLGARAGRAVLAAVMFTACGATAGGNGDDQSAPDGGDIVPPDGSADAPVPCTGGDAQVTDPDTGACYVAFTTTRRTWLDARAQCTALGMDLATVTTDSENQLIVSLVGDIEVFVGGSDRAVEGAFVWTDGTSITFSNWRDNPDPNPDEPNNGNGNYQEDCILIQGQLAGVWDDRPCDSIEVTPPSGTYYAVCERP